ncbi:MAG: NAD(P)/FAD-dependent oxidoreductase [Actinomycetota bacterium]|nr:NAD(P)/FAD-dependent oxidoreductase [Actinomycetota bacterium]
MKVIVIGAGTSGLAATHTLRKRGVEVLVLEAKETAGGRIVGARRDGYTMDLGAQFFFKFYDTTFGICRELGLGNDIVPFPFKVAIWKNGRLNPITAGLNPLALWRDRADLLRFRLFSPRGMLQVARIMPIILKRRRDLHFIDFQNMLDLDDESLADLAKRRGGEEVLEYFLQPVASCLTLGEPEEVGAGYGLTLVWYSLNGLFTLKRGIGTLAERLYEECRDSVRLSSPVKRVVIEGGAVKGVETAEGFMDADAVICSVTATRALELMPDLPEGMRRSLEKVTYSACCHVMFGLEKRLLPEGWYAVGLPRLAGTSMAGFTDNSIKSPHYAPPGGGMVHCFTFGRHAFELNAMSDAEVFKRLKGEIRRFIPSMPEEPYISEIYRWDEAVCLSPPGMLREICRLKRDHYRDVKGLFLAGEYLNMPSVDGSLRSGIDAAEAALRS